MSYKVRPRLKAGSDGRRLVPEAASLSQDMSEGSDATEAVIAAPTLKVDATRAAIQDDMMSPVHSGDPRVLSRTNAATSAMLLGHRRTVLAQPSGSRRPEWLRLICADVQVC